MEKHCSLTFLFNLPLSNLFHCHRLVLLYSKTPKHVIFLMLYTFCHLLPHYNTIINFYFFRLTSIFIEKNEKNIREKNNKLVLSSSSMEKKKKLMKRGSMFQTISDTVFGYRGNEKSISYKDR